MVVAVVAALVAGGLLHALVVATLRHLWVFLGGGWQLNLVEHWVKGLLALAVNGREHLRPHLIVIRDLHTSHGVRHCTEFMANSRACS